MLGGRVGVSSFAALCAKLLDCNGGVGDWGGGVGGGGGAEVCRSVALEVRCVTTELNFSNRYEIMALWVCYTELNFSIRYMALWVCYTE